MGKVGTEKGGTVYEKSLSLPLWWVIFLVFLCLECTKDAVNDNSELHKK